jgi:hypothetical protein
MQSANLARPSLGRESAIMVPMWSDETDSIYDGVDSGPFYSRSSLNADLAAADLVVRAPQLSGTSGNSGQYSCWQGSQ